MKTMKTLALAAAAAGALAGFASTASAAVVCNGEGVCWHVRGRPAFRPEYGVMVHPDNWRWGPREHYAWREHAGRGYWRGGAWVPY